MSETDREASRFETVETVEMELVVTDRIAMMEQANDLVRTLGLKPVIAKSESAYAPDVELSPNEEEAYVAALDFLKQQFATGSDPDRQFITKEHKESTVEHLQQDESDGKK